MVGETTGFMNSNLLILLPLDIFLDHNERPTVVNDNHNVLVVDTGGINGKLSRECVP